MDSAPTYPPRSRHRNARTLKTTLIVVMGGILLALASGAGGYVIANRVMASAMVGYVNEKCADAVIMKECVTFTDDDGVVHEQCMVQRQGLDTGIEGTI